MRDTIHIYSADRSPRLIYVLEELFVRRLGLEYKLHHHAQSYSTVQGAKFLYALDQQSGIPGCEPFGLIQSNQILEQPFPVRMDYGLPVLFSQPNSDLGFDVFSAVFYLLSRYDEYLGDGGSDQHQRFDPKGAIQYRYNALNVPLVEYYTHMVAVYLSKYYPDLKIAGTSWQMEFTLDVDRVAAYEGQGIFRHGYWLCRELLLQPYSALNRLKYLTGIATDPNLKVIKQFVDLVNTSGNKPVVFVQVAGKSKFDTCNGMTPYIQSAIKLLAKTSYVGLHPSYAAGMSPNVLENEWRAFAQLGAEYVRYSRQHFLRYQLPLYYQWLTKIGVERDYSMGFPHTIGFRAGTSVPFRFYDLINERAEQLEIHPFSFMDTAVVRTHMNVQTAFAELKILLNHINRVGGVLSTVWHPEVLRGYQSPISSFSIFQELINKA